MCIRDSPGEEWEMLGRQGDRLSKIHEEQRQESMLQMSVKARRRGYHGPNGFMRPEAVERAVQEQMFVDMCLRMNKERAAKEFLTTREMIMRGRQNEDRYNGGATPPGSPPVRMTDLQSPTRKKYARVNAANAAMDDFSPARDVLAAQHIRDKRDAEAHAVYYDRIQAHAHR
eukprot:TRINITY_DN1979_c0_g1_i4.p2 TRINITY_DN1979_c0_g1~~TRINITY_DN1979_c0_g1_i4.p2  ORF type:complete len:172 (+),score=49.07 TRINITY_DN1979_c0_g1_i4:153-668(+)